MTKCVLCFALRFIPRPLRLALFSGAVLLLPFSASAAGAERDDWIPEIGDRIVVDTNVSMVYLVHPDGSYRAVDGLTGQRRMVSYIGRYYFAGTPAQDWEMRSSEMKGPSVTFGDGRFLRLYDGHEYSINGPDGRTPYGFHSHRSFARMQADKREKNAWDRTGTGHRSMGCILVSEEDLTLIEETWKLNGMLHVQTVAGVDPLAFDSGRAPSWISFLGDGLARGSTTQ
ncbi:MAG: hypothetical protein G01um101425_556 [Candidatus Peregrinibacteria bacterium Gr01-1014_25]|nr:MAG: hypothetical protein G01um101425_556 [Candidatus Peregrinibacteria bacterium Gr01-1014_25]